MKRLSLCLVLASLVPAVAAAQRIPPPPQAPPAPAPVAAPLPPVPPQAPRPPRPAMAPPAPFEPFAVIDSDAIENAVRAATASVDALDLQGVVAAREAAQEAVASARSALRVAPLARINADWDMQDFVGMRGGTTSDANYSSGLSLLQQRQYDQAIVRFDRVIAAKGTHADGALYYKAWALSRLGKSDDAVATLAELRKSYGSSRYQSDAKTLEADVKKLGPSQVDDDDIKLLAIQSLQNSDSDRAVPLLESVLNATNSLALKKRALYVAALIDRPEAHQLLLSYAKGKGNPDLQREAITYLGVRGSKQQTSSADLIAIYNSNPDVDVRMAVISAFRSAGDKNSLMYIASGRGIGSGRGVSTAVLAGDTPMAMSMAERTRAISNLSDLASPQELWPLYQKEENKDLRAAWVSTFASMGAVDQLTQVVKTEKEPTVRQRAIRALGNLKADKTGSLLAELYSSDSDRDTKKSVISALGNQNNADGLVVIARKETDRDLKLEIVRQLVDMAPHSKVAADYLMEIVK
jgi:HEAT repeat protein